MTEDERVYKEAMERMEDLVQEVIDLCSEVADENHFEREWVFQEFKRKLNLALREC